MNTYRTPTEDMGFILRHVLQAPQQLAAIEAFAEVDADLMQQVLDEAGRFINDHIAPLNRSGDEIGAQCQDGQVRLPPGFRDSYQAFVAAGWPSLSAAPEDGGQGLPSVLQVLLYEGLLAANHSWTMSPGLLHGAYQCLRHYASDTLKAQYLPELASGQILPTMCLTEAQAGSDLGLCTTKAERQPDGSYHLSGSKIFISNGDHDLTDNILHLVLAREPDAPAGPRGLSLFLIPKHYPDGSRSAVVCERIEEKMGLHASATCVLRFEAAKGWLVGQAGQGLNAMFVMMNAARLQVSLQGLAHLDAAWQKAHAYAQERLQMRAPGKTSTSPIIEHPAIRRLLDTQRAWVDAGRVLAYQTALELDLAEHHPNAQRRQRAQQWCQLATPVIKAAFTAQGFTGASDCLQVFGGHGYIREWGVEQHLRDARVSMIYEGTNEIQAIDLLVRKVLPDQGEALCALLTEASAELAAHSGAQPHSLAAHARQCLAQVQQLTQAIVSACQPQPLLAYEVADDFLRATALALLAWGGAKLEIAALAQSAPSPRWQTPVQALHRWVLPELDMRCAMIGQVITLPTQS